ncbi:hypothetical protein [Roseicella aquatilis]|uniref:Uncharacterized protein n=1 Tax=Roseicella aquatilis TaxID=2527868 RepID=A0A4R4DM28_9PROT|nr:hypothetical protein [Roseicella aquatilis]TCZ61143.1 hypothetical protein EXY23_13520 [Roseicella aquatilis]
MTGGGRGRGTVPDAGEVIAAVRATGGAKASTYSPLYRWMWAHHDALRDELGAPGLRGQWGRVAAALAARGLTDGGGRAPTARTARETWWKVRRAKAADAAAAARPAGVAAAPASPAPLTQPPPPLPPPVLAEPADDLPPLDGPYTFELARPRGWAPGGGRPGQPNGGGGDADET